MPLAVFRFDASGEVGGGHAVRCLALADALAAQGWTIRFACNETAFAVVPALAARRPAWLGEAGSPAAEPGRLAARLPQGCDLLAVDHYGRGHDFERACRRFARRILVIDDLADRRHDCDILLDQNAADESAYRSLTPPHCRRLLGPTFALLRADFARRRPAALARRKSNTVERLLISCGLTDIQDLTGRALAAIAASALAVDVVVGPDTPNLGAVRDLAAARAAPTTLHVGTDAMAELMAAADLAIGAAGSSSWERCCLGLPAILAVAADNQNVVARRLVASGASLILGLAESVTPAGIAAAIAKLSADGAARRRMSAAGAALCDGLGVGRVAAAVAALSAGD